MFNEVLEWLKGEVYDPSNLEVDQIRILRSGERWVEYQYGEIQKLTMRSYYNGVYIFFHDPDVTSLLTADGAFLKLDSNPEHNVRIRRKMMRHEWVAEIQIECTGEGADVEQVKQILLKCLSLWPYSRNNGWDAGMEDRSFSAL